MKRNVSSDYAAPHTYTTTTVDVLSDGTNVADAYDFHVTLAPGELLRDLRLELFALPSCSTDRVHLPRLDVKIELPAVDVARLCACIAAAADKARALGMLPATIDPPPAAASEGDA